MNQINFFEPKTDIEKMKKGKEKCDVCWNCGAHSGCGRMKRAFNKTMDRRLADVFMQAIDQCVRNQDSTFDVSEVYGDSENLKADFRKLHFWSLVESTGKYREYRITKLGWQFAIGRVSIPKLVTVWRNKVEQSSLEEVDIESLSNRWQKIRQDYVLDFIPVKIINGKTK